jgi:hypothetical protein
MLVVLGLGALAAPAAADKPDPDKLWSFQPLKRASVPAVQHRAWVRTPVDAFILAKLEAAGLTPAPEADRATLIRRLSFDLVGLPPTPAEVEAFVRDPAPDAYEKVVDRLLASPHYGERGATAWLDLVRFAESDGFKADGPRPTAWRYRDYVIRALNQDKPFDRFLSEQLAGDELYPGDADALLATGYLRHYPDEYNAVRLELRRQEILNDITDATGQAFLGLTLGCARCHDHKFDPISQEDYYRFQAFFAAFQPIDVPLASPEEQERYQRRLREWEAKTADLRTRMQALAAPFRNKFVAARKLRFPKEYQAMYDLSAERRTPFQQQMATLLAKQLEPTAAEMVKAMKPDARKEWQALAKQLAAFDGLKPKPPPTGLALTDVGPAAPATHLLKRGELRTKGKELAPGFLEALEKKTPPVPASAPRGWTTGRRSQLARWLTRPDHPLTARVMVNRLWQHHFGRGIVATPSDFGVQGEPPTHPALLDWLACEFTARGWGLKAMHRLIVLSNTYRQSSSAASRLSARIDPDNRLLWRMNRRRLEGEALRDAMLAVSGRLNRAVGGPSVYPELPAELAVSRALWPVSASPHDRARRSVYVFAKRNLRYPLFSAFDAPDGNEPCARRNQSTTAPQALMLLNGRTTLDLARAFAGRVLAEARPADPVIDRAYRLALGRPPQPEEMQASQRFLDTEQRLLRSRFDTKTPPAPAFRETPSPAGVETAFATAVVDLCHVLFNVNEFLYVD